MIQAGAVRIAVRNRAIPMQFEARWHVEPAMQGGGCYYLWSDELKDHFSSPLDERCAFVHARNACDLAGWHGPFEIRFRRDPEPEDVSF